MTVQLVKLITESSNVLAVAQVADEGEHYRGTIDLSATPEEVRALFKLFEELVNGQEFTCADEVESKIDALSIRAVYEDGSAASVTDLQVFPKTAHVSFKVAEPATRNGATAATRTQQSS